MKDFTNIGLRPIDTSRGMIGNEEFFIYFLNQLEGWKTRCKNLHWSAPKKNIHVYLDEFLDIISDYQDGLAEGFMGILGQISPMSVTGVESVHTSADTFIKDVLHSTCLFYEGIPEDTVYLGIKSECETFIQNINKYVYLFSLCDLDKEHKRE